MAAVGLVTMPPGRTAATVGVDTESDAADTDTDTDADADTGTEARGGIAAGTKVYLQTGLDAEDVQAGVGMATPTASSAQSPSPSPTPTPMPTLARADTGGDGLPDRYDRCSATVLGNLVGDMLTELVAMNDGLPLQDGQLTRFHSREAPAMSVRDYLNRVVAHAGLPPAVLLTLIYYMDQLCVLAPGFTISSLTVHRVLIAAATVASKGLSDSFWTNGTYARVGGISARELAILELDLLKRLDWRIIPPEDRLESYYSVLVARSRVADLYQDCLKHDTSSESFTDSNSDDDSDDSGDDCAGPTQLPAQ